MKKLLQIDSKIIKINESKTTLRFELKKLAKKMLVQVLKKLLIHRRLLKYYLKKAPFSLIDEKV